MTAADPRLVVFVRMTILPGRREEFLAGAVSNARASLAESGCHRFEVAHGAGIDGDELLLYEVYRDDRAFDEEHRDTEHYRTWRTLVERCAVPGSQVIVRGRMVAP